jgi:YD repeat-containing protein
VAQVAQTTKRAVRQTDARQIRTNYQYDALNRLQSIDYPQAELNISLSYDQSDTLTGCSKSYPQGRLTQIIYPSGLHLNTTRDAQGRIQTMTYRHETMDARLIDHVTYLPFGPMSTIRFVNGRMLNKQYDLNYRIDALQGGTQGLDLDYVVDEVDQIIQINSGTNSRRYAYDKLHRLTEVRDAPVWRWDLTGDAFGAHAANDDADGDGIRYNFNSRYPGQYFDTETALLTTTSEITSHKPDGI